MTECQSKVYLLLKLTPEWQKIQNIQEFGEQYKNHTSFAEIIPEQKYKYKPTLFSIHRKGSAACKYC